MPWRPASLLSQTKIDKTIIQRTMHVDLARMLVTLFLSGEFEKD
jgi:hypothetical protein